MLLKDKIAVITGASSGIGEATAKKLASQGAIVVLIARRIERLNALKLEIESLGGVALVFKGDVTYKSEINEIVAAVLKQYGRIDILVNNAGIMPLSFVGKLQTNEWENMIDVNIKGVMNCTSSVLPNMMENKSGHIVNVSSVAARKIFPGASVYCATKFAVNAFSEGLRMELSKEYNIRVTVIEPGAVTTELPATITDKELLESMMARYAGMEFLKPEDIAEGIFYAVTQPKRVNVSELMIMPSDQG